MMGRALSDDSPRVPEGHIEDWHEWGADVEYGEDHERFRVFGAVRYEPITQIQGIEVTAASPGAMPEVRTHAMIRRPRDRDVWEFHQNYLVRCHNTPRWGLFYPRLSEVTLGWGVIQDVSSSRCTHVLFPHI